MRDARLFDQQIRPMLRDADQRVSYRAQYNSYVPGNVPGNFDMTFII